MTVDKFGRSLKAPKRAIQGPRGEGYKLTSDGDYDIQNKRLCNLSDPYNALDAVNLKTLNKHCLTTVGEEYNTLNKRICNVGQPVSSGDATTKEYVDSALKTTSMPLTTNIANHQLDINDLKSRLSTTEGAFQNYKYLNQKEINRFAAYIFNYINMRVTGRPSLPQARSNENLNWEDLFKIPEPKEEEPKIDEITIPDEIRRYIFDKSDTSDVPDDIRRFITDRHSEETTSTE